MLRLVAGHAPQAPKTPFVLLVLALLGGGLVSLLLLSSASSADAFTLRTLQQDNRALSIREQGLARERRRLRGARRAAPSGPASSVWSQGAEPGFLVVEPNGTARVQGSPVPATVAASAAEADPDPHGDAVRRAAGGDADTGRRPAGRRHADGAAPRRGPAARRRRRGDTPTPRPTPRTTARTSPKPTPTPGGTR